jgi:flagellar basal body-associated protein FliL
VPTISPAVEEVVMTALAKDPHQRFASVRSFANALEQASQSPVSFPDANVVSQTMAVPQSGYPAQVQQSPVLPDNPEPAQPVQPAQTVMAQPVLPDYAQDPPIPAATNGNPEPVYTPTQRQPEGAISDRHNTPISRPAVIPTQKKRRTGLIIGLIAALVLLVSAGIGAYYYFSQSTPEKTLSAACSTATNNDPQGFFNLLSSNAQSQTTEASIAQQFQQFQSVGGVSNCSFSNVQQNGSNATARVMLTFGNASVQSFNFTLVNENGTWKVDSTATA